MVGICMDVGRVVWWPTHILDLLLPFGNWQVAIDQIPMQIFGNVLFKGGRFSRLVVVIVRCHYQQGEHGTHKGQQGKPIQDEPQFPYCGSTRQKVLGWTCSFRGDGYHVWLVCAYQVSGARTMAVCFER